MIQDVWDKCTGNICPGDISPKKQQKPEQQQLIMDFENGVIVKRPCNISTLWWMRLRKCRQKSGKAAHVG